MASPVIECYRAQNWTDFVEVARNSDIPRILIFHLTPQPGIPSEDQDGDPHNWLDPKIKDWAEILGIHELVGSAMLVDADQMPPGDPFRLMLQSQALDHIALTGDWGRMRELLRVVLSEWPGNMLAQKLEDPHVGLGLSWAWLFRILYYLQYVTDDDQTLRLYQTVVAESYSKHWSVAHD